MPCYSPLKGYRNIINGGITFKRSDSAGEQMEVACGQCLGCRLDRARMWAMRIVHEADLHEVGRSCFITLTYRDEAQCTEQQVRQGFFIPNDWSLCKKHFQDFMKRLRKTREPDKIKFFHVGEYGSKCKHDLDINYCACNVGRPHYHAILFNCCFDDLYPVGQRDDIIYYASKELEQIWKYGFVQVGEVNFESAGYVARYCLKKVTGDMADEHYMNVDANGEVTFVLPEYCTMSRGGRRGRGIAYEWFKRFHGDVFPSDEVPIVGQGVIKKAPRYYDRLLEVVDPILHAEVKKLRAEFKKAHKDEYTPERLMDKYKVKKAQMDLLPRNL